MDAKCTTQAKAQAVQPFLRSCKHESDTPIEGEIKGEIPKWLEGCLLRIGSGLLEVGPDRYNHLFDGLSLMHRFEFQDGKVTYQSRFLRSDSYQRNIKANRIVVSEFGTLGVPDPCKTIFQRFTSLFSREEMSDNDLVNIILYNDEAYACSETNSIWKIDPETLESIQKVNLNAFFPVIGALAHAHQDTDGTIYNMGCSPDGRRMNYCILKFPPKGDTGKSSFEQGSIVCKVPSSRYLSYLHSFAMTPNYFIFVEQPMSISLPRLAMARFVPRTFANLLQWEESVPSRFHVIQRSNGQLLNTGYVSKAFFIFHHINAYEEDNHLIVDMCCYENGDVVKGLYLTALEELVTNRNKCSEPFASRAKRYILPLSVEGQKNQEENLVNLSDTKATAYQQSDGSVYCTPETLTESDPWSPELPRINYESFNGHKYRYFYAIAQNRTIESTHLIKVDTVNKTTLPWSEEGVIPSEPVFISEPHTEKQDEDSGVLLASLLYRDDECKVSMVVLNAKTMTEIGRVTFITKSSVPADFHGTFIPKN